MVDVSSRGSGEEAGICPVCLNRDNVLLRSYRSHSDVFNGTRIVRCVQCELVFANPMPSEGKWDAYNSAYADNAHGGLNLHPEALLFFSGIAQVRIDYVLSYCSSQDVEVRSVLEIGPGHGFFCQHILEKFPSCKYSVVESDDDSRQRLLALGAAAYGNLAELYELDASFDLVIMSHVLEHSIDPHSFLNAAIAYLKPGGVVFVEVPCRDYDFKEEDEPHLVFFDKLAMDVLFGRLDLQDTQLSYHGKEIDRINNPSRLRSFVARIIRGAVRRTRIRFSQKPSFISDWDIWDAVQPHEAHIERKKPAWWLRALGRKPLASARP
jgi:SAM-dependent methyltransferase